MFYFIIFYIIILKIYNIIMSYYSLPSVKCSERKNILNNLYTNDSDKCVNINPSTIYNNIFPVGLSTLINLPIFFIIANILGEYNCKFSLKLLDSCINLYLVSSSPGSL